MDLKFGQLRNASAFKKQPPQGHREELPFCTDSYTPLDISTIPTSREFSLLTGMNTSLEHVCFFDTETTGLSGGAGTLIFQAGIGFFTDNRFTVRQYFISSPGEEPRFLTEIANVLATHPCVVTYNGKSFDIPLLNTRFVLNRLSQPDIQTYDLLHVSRSVWKHRLQSFRLSDIERSILGVFRENDLPGALVPSVYRDYILGRDSGRIHEVLRHNRQDIISLALLLKQLALSCREGNDSHVMLALIRKYAQQRCDDACIDAASNCLKGRVPPDVQREVLWLASLSLKRRGELERAAKIWSRLGTWQANIELAKFMEHSVKDAKAALAIVDNVLSGYNVPSHVRHSLRHRKSRLYRKAVAQSQSAE